MERYAELCNFSRCRVAIYVALSWLQDWHSSLGFLPTICKAAALHAGARYAINGKLANTCCLIVSYGIQRRIVASSMADSDCRRPPTNWQGCPNLELPAPNNFAMLAGLCRQPEVFRVSL